MRSEIARVFRRPQVLLPVLHFSPAASPRATVAGLASAGADGVFLINQGATVPEVLAWAKTLHAENPSLWIGVNLLGLSPAEALASLRNASLLGAVQGLWADDAGLECVDHGAGLRITVPHATTAFATSVRETGLLYFGGVAFKGQRPVPDAGFTPLAAQARYLMDVVTTSGVATGHAPAVSKVRAFARGLDGGALALASGIDVDNVGDYLPDVQAFLVASSLETDIGVFDFDKVRALAARIHGEAR